MSLFKLICNMQCWQLHYLSYIYYSFHRCANSLILQIQSRKMQDSQGCFLCVLSTLLLAVHRMSSTIHSFMFYISQMESWFSLHGFRHSIHLLGQSMVSTSWLLVLYIVKILRFKKEVSGLETRWASCKVNAQCCLQTQQPASASPAFTRTQGLLHLALTLVSFLQASSL